MGDNETVVESQEQPSSTSTSTSSSTSSSSKPENKGGKKPFQHKKPRSRDFDGPRPAPAFGDFLVGSLLSENDVLTQDVDKIRERSTGKLPYMRDQHAMFQMIHSSRRDATQASAIASKALSRNKYMESKMRKIASELELQSKLNVEYEQAQKLYQISNTELREILTKLKEENSALKSQITELQSSSSSPSSSSTI